jgi:elongation factor Ts
MSVDVEDIKSIRKKTGAGMQDCLRALAEAKGSAELAEDLLKAWGLAGVEERSGRAAKEGRVFIREAGSAAAMAEIACETDFVARDEAFLAAGARIAELACERKLFAPDPELEGLISDIARAFRENIFLKRLAFMEGGEAERVFAYLHGDGRIGVLLRAAADQAAAFEEGRVAAFFHDLTLHIAAFTPLFLDEAGLPEAYRRERLEEFRKQVEEDERLRGKSPAMLEGILAGKMKKHLAEVCLLGRGFVKDEKLPVARVLEELRQATGFGLSIEGYACFKVGED